MSPVKLEKLKSTINREIYATSPDTGGNIEGNNNGP
jgi:hypothetical protein